MEAENRVPLTSFPSYEAGRAAYAAKARLKDCPEAPYSREHRAWTKGWRNARRDAGRAPGRYL